MDRSAIEKIESGGDRLKASIKGLGEKELRAFPVPGTWSVQQIVIHLVDSDLVITDRIKRIIAEENPILQGVNETLWSNNLHYHEQSAEDAVALLTLNRRQIARVLRELPDSAFDRTGTHTDRGSMKLSEFVGFYEQHLVHHLKFIHEKREKLGKPI